MQQQPIISARIIKPFIIICVLVLLGFAGYAIKQALTFHITGTNPGTGSVATVSPFFKINFNRQLNVSSVKVSGTDGLIANTSVNGKVITLDLNTPLNAKQTYTITLKVASDAKGDTITNQVFKFTPQYIASSDLPKDQQDALLAQQQNKPATPSFMAFTGSDALTNAGLSLTQVSQLQQEIFNFNAKAKSVAIDPSSVASGPLGGTSFSKTFSLTIDSTPYTASASYVDSNSVTLTLTDAHGVATTIPPVATDASPYSPTAADLKKYPILKQLPHTGVGQGYLITYGGLGGDSGSGFSILVTYTTAAGQGAAEQWIQSQGVDPSTLPIAYSNMSQ